MYTPKKLTELETGYSRKTGDKAFHLFLLWKDITYVDCKGEYIQNEDMNHPNDFVIYAPDQETATHKMKDLLSKLDNYVYDNDGTYHYSLKLPDGNNTVMWPAIPVIKQINC